MKKTIKIIIAILILAIVSGYYFWQRNKNQIVKNLIANSVSKFTDSLYTLKYDSSLVDEINGEAYFENVKLQADSIKLKQLSLVDSIPDILINITIKSITANGLDIPLALNEQKIYAKKIILNEPLVTIIQMGKKTFKQDDSIALFRKILGNYNSIHAKQIELMNAKFVFKNSEGKEKTKLTKLNISFDEIVVDSTKDYKNVISYFINNMKANAEQLSIHQENKNSIIIFDKISYNSHEKFLSLDRIRTIKEGKNETQYELKSVKFEDLNVHDFIYENTINVGNISIDNSLLTIYLNKKSSSNIKSQKQNNFDFPEEYFDKIKIGGISIGKSTLLFRSRSEPNKAPIQINGFEFHLSKNMNISERSNLRSLLDNAKWNMKADDFTLTSKDNKYKLLFSDLKVDKATASASISSFTLKPALNEKAMASTSNYQQDIYDIEMSAIHLKGIEINKFINESALQMQELELKLNLKVYHDRVPDENPVSKIGNYPHQLLLAADITLMIKKVIIKNSEASYRERAKETKQIGKVFFTNIEGEIFNVTNDKIIIQQNPICNLKGSGLLLGKTKCATDWRLFLNTDNGKFELDAQIGAMNFADFNPLIKPLASTTIEGKLNSLSCKMQGDDLGAKGDLLMLYSDLTIVSYKLSDDSLLFETKKTKSMVNNLFVKNNNVLNKNTRYAKFSVQRDIHKSFFNLVWKSALDGIQNTIMNKNVADLKKQLKKSKK
jgi:lipopolysaccharide export system protein LptC